MNNLFKLIAVVIGTILIFGSCHGRQEDSNYGSQPGNSSNLDSYQTPDSVREAKMMVAYIDSLKARDTEIQSELDNIKQEIRIMHDYQKWFWLALGLGFIALCFGIILLMVSQRITNRLNKCARLIKEIQENHADSAIAPTSPKVRPNYASTFEVKKLADKLSEVNSQVQQLWAAKASVTSPQSGKDQQPIELPKPVTSKEETKQGYFGNPIQAANPYFRKWLSSKDSDARFSVEQTGAIAIFKPLEDTAYLGTFVSTDAIRSAVEFQGCEPTTAATHIKVINPGEAQQIGEKWIVTKKAVVKLS